MDPDLSQDFNYGIVPPPDLDWDPSHLQRPGWQPDPAQVRTARWQLLLVSAVLVLLSATCLFFALTWRF